MNPRRSNTSILSLMLTASALWTMPARPSAFEFKTKENIKKNKKPWGDDPEAKEKYREEQAILRRQGELRRELIEQAQAKRDARAKKRGINNAKAVAGQKR